MTSDASPIPPEQPKLRKRWDAVGKKLDDLEGSFRDLPRSRRTRVATLRVGAQMLECVLAAAFTNAEPRRMPWQLVLLLGALQDKLDGASQRGTRSPYGPPRIGISKGQ